MSDSQTSARAPAQYCPYCGETNLWPEESHGSWACHDCYRVFTVRFLGVKSRTVTPTESVIT